MVQVNAALGDDPGLVNSSPTEEGWFLKLRLGDQAQLEALMNEAAYKSFREGLA